MSVKKIITVPNPLLRKKTKLVANFDKKLKKLIDDLADTAKAAKEPEGIGLSAIQVGNLNRVFVIKKGHQFIPFINPEITWSSKKTFSQLSKAEDRFLEGCLSVPGYYALIDRPYEVNLSWQNLKGNLEKERFKGKESAYVQHELDHLDGILFVDRALKQGEKIYQLQKDKEGEDQLVEVDFK